MKFYLLAAAAKSLQSCLTLFDPIDGSPPGFPVPGILQARTLEWVAISSSNAWKWKVKVKLLSRVWLVATPRTAAYQAPPSMGFSRQEYWSGVGCHCLLPICWRGKYILSWPESLFGFFCNILWTQKDFLANSIHTNTYTHNIYIIWNCPSRKNCLSSLIYLFHLFLSG